MVFEGCVCVPGSNTAYPWAARHVMISAVMNFVYVYLCHQPSSSVLPDPLFPLVTCHKVYPKIFAFNASVEDPRIMGVIREQGGKVFPHGVLNCFRIRMQDEGMCV